MKPTDSRSAYRLGRILDMLLDQDLDQKQITEGLCMSAPGSIVQYLTYLRAEKKAHICGWRPPGVNGHRWPIYRFGKGCNARKPKPKTHAEVMRAYWRRKGCGRPVDPAPIAHPFATLFNLPERRV